MSFDPNNVYHVYPINDLKFHILNCEYPEGKTPYCPCECKPEWKEEDNALLIVHNSFDGREGVEWVNELLADKPPFT